MTKVLDLEEGMQYQDQCECQGRQEWQGRGKHLSRINFEGLERDALEIGGLRCGDQCRNTRIELQCNDSYW